MFNKSNLKGRKALVFIVLVLSLMLQSTIRQRIVPLTIGVLLISYIIVVPRPKFLIKLLTGLILIIALLLSGKLNLSRVDTFLRARIRQALSIHQASAGTKGSNYRILDDKYYLLHKNPAAFEEPDLHWWYVYHVEGFNYLQYFQTLVRGWAHFLFEPFPWKIDTKLKLLAYPQMIIWYLFTPFVFLGSLILLRYRWREYLILFVYFGVVVSGCALTMANIGTAFRFRDMVSPIVLMFAAVGVGRLVGWEIFKKNDEVKV